MLFSCNILYENVLSLNYQITLRMNRKTTLTARILSPKLILSFSMARSMVTIDTIVLLYMTGLNRSRSSSVNPLSWIILKKSRL